ncbi:MAG: recombination mediator RecR [Candidatus Wallbacteria bacterium]|nr:recombination mediator RecR [Candidatus Wallbacteria bacterium]
MKRELLPPKLSMLQEFVSSLPGIGARSGRRILIHLLNLPATDQIKLAGMISSLPEEVRCCSTCHFFLRNLTCPLCGDQNRDSSTICVVEIFSDVLGIDDCGYKGLFHILGGTIRPLRGVGPENLNIASLLTRIHSGVREVILALNPETEGEMTMHYLHGILKSSFPHLTVTRLAFGLPVGANLEFCDPKTLGEALKNRHVLEEDAT